MDDSMVTARMLEKKKREGARILSREGLSASQAINLMYDRMIEAEVRTERLRSKGLL